MPDWLAVILLGVIEGVTEFLPISSRPATCCWRSDSGLLGRRSELFNVGIQAGAVLAVTAIVFCERHVGHRCWASECADDRDDAASGSSLAAFVVTAVVGVLVAAEARLRELARKTLWRRWPGRLVVGGVLDPDRRAVGGRSSARSAPR